MIIIKKDKQIIKYVKNVNTKGIHKLNRHLISCWLGNNSSVIKNKQTNRFIYCFNRIQIKLGNNE